MPAADGDHSGVVDPYEHLHDEAYARPFALGRVGADGLVTTAGRTLVSLDGDWRFCIDPHDEGLRQAWYADEPLPAASWIAPRDYDDGAWQTVPVPSCWNTQKPEWRHYEGGAWYTRLFEHRPGPVGERVMLHVGAAAYEARVFLNGAFIGAHRGASTPFCLELTEHLRDGTNRLQIQVDNARRAERVPMHHTDWFNYGGLYRSVSLLRLPPVFIRDFGVGLVPGSGFGRVFVDIALSAPVYGEATVAIDGLLPPHPIPVTGGRGRIELELAPELWSPDAPRLYDVTLGFGADTVADRIGFREIRVEGERILLNGRDVVLRGVSVHEDDLHSGKTSGEADIRRRYADAKELGCNFLRLAHYPHDARAAAIADEVGLMLWAEIPVYWAIDFTGPDSYDDAANQLAELITRDRNRASVILWGVGNENADTDARLSFMGRLAGLARALDPTRLVTAACLIDRQRFAIADRLADSLDVIGLNEYFGWYEPSFDGLRRLLANSAPGKPVIISEFGADAVAGLRGGARELFTEDCQEAVYREQLAILATAPYVRGLTPWILYDFRTERRQTAFQRGWNRKGLIAEDKTTRKRAFAVLADHYSALAAAETRSTQPQEPEEP
ncbi:glycoside hydrolase family 2 [Azospirillum sp. RWY-5-1]|uniref:Glycoside hydrolase family 2 n=1 Tax=Azospirillum oleiclasticum TaxID=2735135 RepID=A0ABX2TG18_9PROT|nr:glycoside hydrolase family 2 TIM barrel-domain containing protein [Azospirillum oleiclasticum]NYZ16111.1 glycoside hydrolase family 2 [Azospirillum oleiclasticum]NYZ22992.1 glycoside hydrolase family 2 [Azospirillum oleiclasticum]